MLLHLSVGAYSLDNAHSLNTARAPRRRVRMTAHAPSPALSADLGEPSTLYAPFAERALELLRDAVPLRPYAIPPELRRREGSSGRGARAQPVRVSAEAFRSDKLRQIRLAHVQGGDSLQVLNLCIFPRLEYGLPSFAADLVTLPGGHLIFIDCAPHAADRRLGGDAAALEAAHARHSLRLPDGGPIPAEAQRFFSPCFLWTRLPLSDEGNAAVRGPVFGAFEDYLRGYLAMVAAAAPLDDAAARAEVRAEQLAYATYRAEKDPARGMLSRLFGAEFTERLIDEVLFDLPRAIAAGGEL